MKTDDIDLYTIDLNRLEEETINQTKLFREWAGHLKKSQAKLRKLKARLERVKAKLSVKVYMNPTKYGLKEKPVPTAGMITGVVICLKPYRKVEKLVWKEKEKMDDLEVVVKALDDRRKAIEGAIRLHGQEYFSKPWTQFKGARKKKRVKDD